MKCPNPQCNELNEPDALFCHNCGTKLSTQQIVKQQTGPNPLPQDKSSPISKIVFILLILGIIGLGAYMLFFNSPTPIISLVPNTANDTVTVAVDIPITVYLNRTLLNMRIGQNERLSATVQPSNVPNREVQWFSSDPSVATVSNGNVTALQTGSVTIRARAVADESKFAECVVNVKGDVVINYPFGRYEGRVSNDIPDGQGTMRYTCRIRIARHARSTYYADNGDTFTGTWKNGDIEHGTLRERNGNQKAVITAGRRPSQYNLNNDRCE